LKANHEGRCFKNFIDQGEEPMSLEPSIPQSSAWHRPPGPEDYDALFSPHLKLLRNVVIRRVPRIEDADDVVQQTLLLGLRHIGQFRFQASLGTWLCRIAINVIRGLYRKRGYFSDALTDPSILESVDISDPNESPLAILERTEKYSRLRMAISQLPATYRQVVELRDLEGFSIEETANHLGLTKPAVKSRHHRARALLLRLIRNRKSGVSSNFLNRPLRRAEKLAA
jgi:RNA polymerase sigma-70 factor (ECF subfamily)